MAYQRKGRPGNLPLHVMKPPPGLQSTADLPTQVQYRDAKQAAPGAVSVVARPVSIYNTVPAGGKKFAYQAEVVLGLSSEIDVVFTPNIPVPRGYVMVIESWQVVLRGYPQGFGGNPRYSARIMNTLPLVCTLRVNEMAQAGTERVEFDVFDNAAPCHVVAYNNDQISARIEYFTPPDWVDYPPLAVLRIEGNLLLPNLQAPEYTELEIGRVRVE